MTRSRQVRRKPRVSHRRSRIATRRSNRSRRKNGRSRMPRRHRTRSRTIRGSIRRGKTRRMRGGMKSAERAARKTFHALYNKLDKPETSAFNKEFGREIPEDKLQEAIQAVKDIIADRPPVHDPDERDGDEVGMTSAQTKREQRDKAAAAKSDSGRREDRGMKPALKGYNPGKGADEIDDEDFDDSDED